jgi:hypothetical protein
MGWRDLSIRMAFFVWRSSSEPKAINRARTMIPLFVLPCTLLVMFASSDSGDAIFFETIVLCELTMGIINKTRLGD